MKAGLRIAAVALLAVSCKSADEAPADAGPPPPDPRIDPRTGLALDLGPKWVRGPTEPGSGILLDARWEPAAGPKRWVAPRMVVTKVPLEPSAEPTDTLLRQTLASTKAGLPSTQAKILRTSTSRWFVGAVEIASFALRYQVIDPKGGVGQDVIHTSAVAVPTEGVGYVITGTHVVERDDSLGREVDRVLRSVHFGVAEPPASPEGSGEAEEP